VERGKNEARQLAEKAKPLIQSERQGQWNLTMNINLSIPQLGDRIITQRSTLRQNSGSRTHSLLRGLSSQLQKHIIGLRVKTVE